MSISKDMRQLLYALLIIATGGGRNLFHSAYDMNLLENWKLSLAWGCLVIFFAFPVVMMTIHLLKSPYPTFASEFKYVGEYLRTVAAIIISLAGFSTIEVFKSKPKDPND